MKFTKWCCVLLLCACLCAPARALMVEGREIEDIYAYILQVLKEQEQAEATYQEKVKQGVEYRGNRPYGFNALRHLTMDDLIYGAVQGGLTAVRELGPDATPSQLAAKAEANIQTVMEMFPMLANNFLAGEALLKRMKGSNRRDYMQMFLLRRCKPGIASDSLFSLYWQEELRRNRSQYISTLGGILDSPNAEPEAVALALPLYVEAADAAYEEAFARDAGARKLREADPALTPDAVFADPALMSQLENPTALHERTEGLAAVRERLVAQSEPTMQRSKELVETAKGLLAAFDARHPAVAGMKVKEQPKPLAPSTEGEGEAEGEAPLPEESPESDVPKIGIPTLKF